MTNETIIAHTNWTIRYEAWVLRSSIRMSQRRIFSAMRLRGVDESQLRTDFGAFITKQKGFSDVFNPDSRSIPITMYYLLSEYLEVDPSWLMTGDGKAPKELEKLEAPVISEVHNSFPLGFLLPQEAAYLCMAGLNSREIARLARGNYKRICLFLDDYKPKAGEAVVKISKAEKLILINKVDFLVRDRATKGLHTANTWTPEWFPHKSATASQ